MIYQKEIKQMPLNGFLMGKSYLSDVSALSAEEFRQLTCMLDMFAKYGQEPEAYHNNSMLYRQLLEKYADKVYKKKLDNYIANMQIDTTAKLEEFDHPISNWYRPSDINEIMASGDDDEKETELFCDERGLAINLVDFFIDDYCGEIRTCSNIYDYAVDLQEFIDEYNAVFDEWGIEDPFNDGRIPDAMTNLQMIIDHGELIEDPKKRNEFLRTFDFEYR